MIRTAGCAMMVVTCCAVISAPECSISSAQVCPKPLRGTKNGFVLSARSAATALIACCTV